MRHTWLLRIILFGELASGRRLSRGQKRHFKDQWKIWTTPANIDPETKEPVSAIRLSWGKTIRCGDFRVKLKRIFDVLPGGTELPIRAHTHNSLWLLAYNSSGVAWAFTTMSATREENGNNKSEWRYWCTDVSGCWRVTNMFSVACIITTLNQGLGKIILNLHYILT